MGVFIGKKNIFIIFKFIKKIHQMKKYLSLTICSQPDISIVSFASSYKNKKITLKSEKTCTIAILTILMSSLIDSRILTVVQLVFARTGRIYWLYAAKRVLFRLYNIVFGASARLCDRSKIFNREKQSVNNFIFVLSIFKCK